MATRLERLARGGMKAGLVFTLALTAPSWLSAQTAPAGQDAADADWISGAGDYLRPGDQIRLTFWREPGLNGDYVIDERGVVILPLIGEKLVTTVPVTQLKLEIIDRLSEELWHQPSVLLMKRIRVLGEVTSPGLYHVDPTMTLGDVLAMASGITGDGRTQDIHILRDGREIFRDLDLSTSVATRLRSGDQVLVPRNGWFSRNATWVMGGVISATGLVLAAFAAR